MKLIHVCLIFGLSFFFTGCRNVKQQNKAQFVEKQSTQADNFKDEISRIDDFVLTVNSHKPAFTIEKTILGPDDGGKLTGYYNNQGLTKIEVWLGMSNNALSNQFYFKNGRLIFAGETRKYYSWDQDKGQINRNQFSKIKNDKYYFQNGILIQHIPSGKVQSEKSDMQNQAKTYISFLSGKGNVVYLNLFPEK